MQYTPVLKSCYISFGSSVLSKDTVLPQKLVFVIWLGTTKDFNISHTQDNCGERKTEGWLCLACGETLFKDEGKREGRKRIEEKGVDSFRRPIPLPEPPLVHFTLSQFFLGALNRGQTTPAGDSNILGFAMHLSVTATRDRSQRRTRVDSAILLEKKKQLNQDLSLTVDSPGQSLDLAYNAFQSHS